MACPIYTYWKQFLDGVSTTDNQPICYVPLNDTTKAYSVLHSGTCQTGTNASFVYFDVGFVATNDYYIGKTIRFTNDTPAGILGVERVIGSFDSGGYASFDTAIAPVPTTSTTYAVIEYFESDPTTWSAQHEKDAKPFTNSPLTGVVGGMTFSGANPISVNDVAHGLVTGDFVAFSSVVGSVATTVNDKTFQVTRTDDDNFTLDGTVSTGLAYTSGGTWEQTGYLLYGSPTFVEPGPFEFANDAKDGCIYLDGVRGGLDFGSDGFSGYGEAALSRAISNPGNSAVQIGGVWFRVDAYPTEYQAYQLLHIPQFASGARSGPISTITSGTGGLVRVNYVGSNMLEGDIVSFGAVTGAVELSNGEFVVKRVNNDSFELYGTVFSDFGSFTNGVDSGTWYVNKHCYLADLTLGVLHTDVELRFGAKPWNGAAIVGAGCARVTVPAADAGEWCLAVFSASRPTRQLQVFYYSSSYPDGLASSIITGGWSTGTPTANYDTSGLKSTLGYHTVSGNWFKGHLANFFMVGGTITTGIATWAVDVQYIGKNLYHMGHGDVPWGKPQRPRATMFSVQNLRI